MNALQRKRDGDGQGGATEREQFGEDDYWICDMLLNNLVEAAREFEPEPELEPEPEPEPEKEEHNIIDLTGEEPTVVIDLTGSDDEAEAEVVADKEIVRDPSLDDEDQVVTDKEIRRDTSLNDSVHAKFYNYVTQKIAARAAKAKRDKDSVQGSGNIFEGRKEKAGNGVQGSGNIFGGRYEKTDNRAQSSGHISEGRYETAAKAKRGEDSVQGSGHMYGGRYERADIGVQEPGHISEGRYTRAAEAGKRSGNCVQDTGKISGGVVGYGYKVVFSKDPPSDNDTEVDEAYELNDTVPPAFTNIRIENLNYGIKVLRIQPRAQRGQPDTRPIKQQFRTPGWFFRRFDKRNQGIQLTEQQYRKAWAHAVGMQEEKLSLIHIIRNLPQTNMANQNAYIEAELSRQLQELMESALVDAREHVRK